MRQTQTLPQRVHETVARFSQRLDWLPRLLLRLVFGYFWLETGLAKWHNHDFFTQRFANWHIIWPSFNAYLSAATDLVGGALLMLGLCTRVACVPMIVNMLVALVIVVLPDVHTLDDFVELDEVLYALVLFWLLVAGPGRASLDHLLARAASSADRRVAAADARP